MKTLHSLTKFLMMALLSFTLIGVNSHESDAQFLKKLLKKRKKRAKKNIQTNARKTANHGIKPYAKDFEDETGVSGTYYAATKVAENEVMKFHFEKRSGGEIVNRLTIYVNEKGNQFSMLLDEKIKEKLNIHYFRYQHSEGSLVELEKGVFAAFNKKKGEITNVFVKDKAKLTTYDNETALAKYQQINKKVMQGKLERTKKRLMKYAAYKNNIGKVVYVKHYNHFNRLYGDKPSEDPKLFKTSLSMGSSIFWGAYLKMPPTYTCGTDCQWNAVYEMNGIKTSRAKLRNKSRKWNRNIKKKNVDPYFCMNKGYSLINHRAKIWDYAYVYCLFQNKAKFRLGQSYKITTRIYTNKDGNDQQMIAEGSINLKYDQKAQQVLKKVFEQFQEFLDE